MLAALNFMTLILSRLIRQMLVNCFGVDSKGLYQRSGKEKESCCLVFPSSTKREIGHIHVVVVQRRQRNVHKSVMHVQNCGFATLNLLLFRCFRCRRRRRILSSLLTHWRVHSNDPRNNCRTRFGSSPFLDSKVAS